MADACRACNGMGFGEIDPDFGYRATAKPCPVCNPTAEGAAPPKVTPKKPSKTVAFVDGKGKSSADDEGLSLDEAVAQGIFTEEAAEASIASELEK